MSSGEWTFGELVEASILDVGDGYRAKNSELGGTGPIFLRSAYLQDQGFLAEMPERFLVDDASRFGAKAARLGDVVITTKGNSTGRVGVIRPEQVGAVYSPHLSYWRSLDASKIDQRFLCYWSRSPAFRSQLAGMAYSTDMAPYLSLRDQKRLRITLPEIAVQRSVGELLSALDDKIELNRRMNETLEAMARAIFRDWFVDFGPTRRQVEGATDPVTIMGGLVQDPGTAQILARSFPDQLDEVRRPLGWEEHNLGDAFDLVMGQSPPGSTYNEEGDGLPFFQGRRDFSARFPVARVYCTAPTRTARKDWTLVSVRAPVGDVNRAEADCCIGRGVGALSHKQGLLSFTYYAVLNLQPALAAFEGDGTVFGSVNQKQIKALKMLGGTSPLAKTYDDLAKPIDAMIRLRTAENRTLAATRDLLLPKLMSGEIRLREAEEILEAAQ